MNLALRLSTVAGLAVLALTAPVAATAPAGAAERCALAGTARAVQALTRDHGIVGAAIDVRGPGCGRWTAASGVADLRSGRLMPVDERIRIGSTTKTFTATVVLQLVGEGRVELDAPIERYLPGVVHGNGYDGRRITVRQLLQHTSGLPDHVDALDWDHPETFRWRTFTPLELVRLALTQPPPPAEWAYSTTNAVLAGMLVERVTGRSVETEVTRRIIAPLGLRDTYWPGRETGIRGPHPRGYWMAPDGGADKVDVTRFTMSFGGAGGALVSTLDDEQRFFAALFHGRLLRPAQLTEMMRTVPADPDRTWEGAQAGLGVFASPLPECGGVFWGHGGTTPGFKSFGGTTADGRQAQLVINDGVSTEEAFLAFLAVVRTALCELR